MRGGMGDSSLHLQESGWEELRKEARKIEGDLDVKLSSYAKLASRFTHSSSGLVPTPHFPCDLTPSDALDPTLHVKLKESE